MVKYTTISFLDAVLFENFLQRPIRNGKNQKKILKIYGQFFAKGVL